MDRRYPNPKLTALKEIILNKMKDDSRGIVFCKTRELTLALEHWMGEDPRLKRLSPRHLTGAHANVERGGKVLQFKFVYSVLFINLLN